MKSRTIAIAGSIAVLACTATPVAALAATGGHHRAAAESQLDRSRDVKRVGHADRSADRSKDRADNSRDVRDVRDG